METSRNYRMGFTLAELLIVVAIISVLAAVAIPIYTASKDKAYLATNQYNIRAAKGAAGSDYMLNESGKYAVYCYSSKGELVSIKTLKRGTFDTYIDPNHDICYAASAASLGTDPVKAINSWGNNLFERNNKDYYDPNAVYQYIAVCITPAGQITTCPYYDETSNSIKYDTFK